MNLPKKIFFLLFPVFLAYRSIELLKILNLRADEPTGLIQSFFIAVVINIYITGIFAIPGFAFPTHKLIGSSYFKLKNPELLKNLYDKLGVEGFRKLLMRFFWGAEKNRKKYFDGTRKGFENFIYQSKQSEIGHLLPFIFLTIISLWLLYKGYLLMAVIAFAINFIGNFYPVLLQRFHRIRIEKVMSRYTKQPSRT